MFKRLVFGSLALMLSGCESTTPPDWYVLETNSDSDYIYAVGEARTLNLAKKSALANINEQLWTQVDSSFSSDEQFRAINDESLRNENVRNSVNAKSAQLTFTGTEYLKTDQNDIAYYVQARVKRENVKDQLLAELSQIEEQSVRVIKNFSHQDKLVWWLNNRDLSDEISDYYVRVGILTSMGLKYDTENSQLIRLIPKVSQAKSDLYIYIQPGRQDKRSAAFISEKFNLEGISTTQKWSAKNSHVLKMDSEYRQSKVGDAYITTKVTQLTLKNKQGKTISSGEIISTGNSVSNFKLSHEGAERHFSQQLDEMGIWHALGLKK